MKGRFLQDGAGSFLPYDEMQSVDAVDVHAAIAYPLEFRITKHVPHLYPLLSAAYLHRGLRRMLPLWIQWISGGAGHPLVTWAHCYPHINFCIGQWVIVRDPPSSRVYTDLPACPPPEREREREKRASGRCSYCQMPDQTAQIDRSKVRSELRPRARASIERTNSAQLLWQIYIYIVM